MRFPGRPSRRRCGPRALGFELTSDPTSGVLTLSSGGHQVFLGIGTTQVPVDQRIVQISRPARSSGGFLYAPPDILDRVLLPLVGRSVTSDPTAGFGPWSTPCRR